MDKLERIIKKNITHVLSGLQGTNYPISYIEKDEVLKKYIKLTYEEFIEGKRKRMKKDELLKDKNLYKRQSKKYFTGPFSISLERKNITPQKYAVFLANSFSAPTIYF